MTLWYNMPKERQNKVLFILKGLVMMKNKTAEKLLITPMEACKLLGIGRTTMYSWIKKHTIPVVRFPHCRNVYISVESLKEMINKNTVTTNNGGDGGE